MTNSKFKSIVLPRTLGGDTQAHFSGLKAQVKVFFWPASRIDRSRMNRTSEQVTLLHFTLKILHFTFS